MILEACLITRCQTSWCLWCKFSVFIIFLVFFKCLITKERDGKTHTLPSFHISNLFIGQPSLEEKGEACNLVGWDVKNSHLKSLYS